MCYTDAPCSEIASASTSKAKRDVREKRNASGRLTTCPFAGEQPVAEVRSLAKMVTGTKFRAERSLVLLCLHARKIEPVTTFAEPAISSTGS